MTPTALCIGMNSKRLQKMHCTIHGVRSVLGPHGWYVLWVVGGRSGVVCSFFQSLLSSFSATFFFLTFTYFCSLLFVTVHDRWFFFLVNHLPVLCLLLLLLMLFRLRIMVLYWFMLWFDCFCFRCLSNNLKCVGRDVKLKLKSNQIWRMCRMTVGYIH